MLHPREDYARIQDPAGLIPKDEPVFLLRAQDAAAAGTVRFWADSNSRMGGDPELSLRALRHAELMEAWPVHKLADLPAEPESEENARRSQAINSVYLPEQPPDSAAVLEENTEPVGETFPEQKHREAKEVITVTDEQKMAIINEHISHLPENITSREQVIASAIFIDEVRRELGIALDCPAENVPEKLADYMGFTAAESEKRPGSGVS